MSVLSLALRSYFLFSTVGFVFISDAKALATSCRVYPSEYAYRDDSVNRAESASANCRRYPVILGLPAGVHSTDYTHCDGIQLKLADTNRGSEQFNSSSHYQWSAGSDGQLLFILPTRVSLTTITLHYYSDSIRGLPRLRFYAVPDDFDVWDALTTGTPYGGVAAIPPGGDPAGRRSVSIMVNFNTKKVLIYKFSNNFQFAVSEVEFSTMSCSAPSTAATTENNNIITISQKTLPIITTSTIINFSIPLMTTTEESTENESLSSTTLSNDKQTQYCAINPRESTAWALIVILVVLLMASVVINVILILALSLRAYRRRNKANDLSPDCALAMDSNPCYEASNVKQTEAQEAVHVYETVKQHS